MVTVRRYGHEKGVVKEKSLKLGVENSGSMLKAKKRGGERYACSHSQEDCRMLIFSFVCLPEKPVKA